MNGQSKINKVKIVFFSGTGSTSRVAYTLKKSMEEQARTIIMYELNNRNTIMHDQEDMLIVIYPVHACNAPEAVYEYIHAIPRVEKTLSAVISVSGGGEITPNTACRLHCIRLLEKKGFKVTYERMLVMPSNWVVPTIDGLAVKLLQVLPSRVEAITKDLLSCVQLRTRPNLINRFLSSIGEFEKYGARWFGKRIKANQNCNGCGWCEKNCPRANITLINHRPAFNGNCSICLKCIYGCPQNALAPGYGKFVVIKQGYDLNAIEKRMDNQEECSIEQLAKGYLWKGIKEYLLESDEHN